MQVSVISSHINCYYLKYLDKNLLLEIRFMHNIRLEYFF